MKRLLALFIPAAALLLHAGSSAHADTIPAPNAVWGYNFTPVDNSSTVLTTVSADAPAGGGTPGGVSFTNEAAQAVIGNSDVVATNLHTFSAVRAPAAEAISNGAYNLALTIYDLNAPGALAAFQADPNSVPHSTPILFSGHLGGNFSQDNANVSNLYTGPNLNGQGLPTAQVSLNDFTYTISLYPLTPPGPQSSSLVGSISAHVDVTTSTVGAATAPEPSTMLLACLSLPFVGGAAWRKRRRAALAA